MVGDVEKRGMEEVTDLLTPSPYVDPGKRRTEGGREGGRERSLFISYDHAHISSLPPSLPPSFLIETGKVGPSGVGPLTLPMLLYSTLASAL
jgi:hypothetical protein